MITVLVTTVGSGIGQSVIDSLNISKEYRIIGCNSNRNVYAYSYCDTFYEVSSFLSEGYLQEIIDICIKNNVDIVIPGHDKELTLFAENRNAFVSKAITVLVSEPTITEISRNKQDWFNFFAPKGCKIVPTYSLKEFKKSVDVSLFPAIVKPSGGSASQGISIINTIEDLRGLNEEDIIQPYLFPEEKDSNYSAIKKAVDKGDFIQKSEISIQLLFNKNSKHSAIFISKNTLKNGVPIYVDPIDPENFEYLDEILKFVPILEERKVIGPVNIQGRIASNGLYFFEMNMRFTGITGNRALLGFNEVDYLVRDFLGKPASIKGYAINKVGVRQVACTTIPKVRKVTDKKIATVLGAGSTVGQHFMNTLDIKKFSKIYLVTRPKSITKYTTLFKNSIFEIISDKDNKFTTCFTQSDILINFVSALAFEKDQLKYNATRFIYKMIPKIAKAKIPKIINVSSQSVYNQKENISKKENSKTVNQTSYAFQKIIIEDFFTSINEFSTQSKIINLRFSRILAPTNINQLGFFGNIVTNAINGKKTTITNPNNNTNLIHIDDVCNAINYVIETNIDNTTLNVGGENISMKAYCEEVINQLSLNNNLIVYGADKTVQSSSMINIDRILDLGWKPKYSMQKLITAIIKNNKGI